MALTGDEIRSRPFVTERKGGYNPEDVIAYLEEVAVQFDELHARFAREHSDEGAAAAEIDHLRSLLASHEGLEAALQSAGEDDEQLRAELRSLREESDEITQRMHDDADPAAAVGHDVATLLRSAKEATAELRKSADRDCAALFGEADHLRTSAERAASQMRSDAHAQAADIVARARREGERMVDAASLRYDELLEVQDEVARRLSDAGAVIRSARDANAHV